MEAGSAGHEPKAEERPPIQVNIGITAGHRYEQWAQLQEPLSLDLTFTGDAESPAEAIMRALQKAPEVALEKLRLPDSPDT